MVWCFLTNLIIIYKEPQFSFNVSVHSSQTINLHFWNTFQMPGALKVLRVRVSMNSMLNNNFRAEWAVRLPVNNFAAVPHNARGFVILGMNCCHNKPYWERFTNCFKVHLRTRFLYLRYFKFALVDCKCLFAQALVMDMNKQYIKILFSSFAKSLFWEH